MFPARAMRCRQGESVHEAAVFAPPGRLGSAAGTTSAPDAVMPAAAAACSFVRSSPPRDDGPMAMTATRGLPTPVPEAFGVFGALAGAAPASGGCAARA